MCGIAGLLGNFNDHQIQLRNMLGTLVHRGPDEEGVYVDEIFAGGMRRLSINDLSGGSQPLYNHDKSVVLFYNGEIYNSGELRRELEARGKIFRTHSDGEVIVHLYDDFGEETFKRLDGMFAVALWDKRRHKLLLARDLAGEKPLYFARVSKARLAFASEVKALERISSLSLTLDRQAIWDFPSFLWIPEPRTAYKEIEALPRGHFLVASEGETSIRPFRNSFTKASFDIADDIAVVRTTRKVVEEAIRSRLMADVPIGSFLSGGLDSSIVATIAARELPRLDTFTVSFEDINDPYHGKADESEAAARTAAKIGSRHHVVRVTADSFRRNLNDFCRFGDQPFSVSSGLGVLAVAAAAHELDIKVLLTGDGADECFGGYSWYEYLSGLEGREEQVDTGRAVSFQNVGLSLQKRLDALAKMSPDRRAWAWHYYADETEKAGLFSADWMDGLHSSLVHFKSLSKRSAPEDFIRHDRNFYFPNEMLKKVDRMTMAYSVEGRTPFAAPAVLALADKLSLRNMVRGKELKWALRRAFEDILPSDIISRPKHGFNVPIDHWLRTEWADMVDETFEEGSALRRAGIVSRDSLSVAKRLLADPERLNGHTIFSFIMLNKWLGR